jgi:hypothetical protein
MISLELRYESPLLQRAETTIRRLLPLLLVFVALAARCSVAVAQSSATTKPITYQQEGHHAVIEQALSRARSESGFHSSS